MGGRRRRGEVEIELRGGVWYFILSELLIK